MTDKYDSLFTEKTLKNLTLENRYIVAPMTRVSAESDGQANDRMKQYYERYAKGGFAAIISEGIYTDKKYSQGYDNQPGLAKKDHVEAWKPVVDAVHQHGTKIIAQLMHAGGQVQSNPYVDETIAPSAIAPKGEQLGFYGGSGPFPTPREMSLDDIQDVIDSFARAAIKAKKAGFDGVEIHGANGYLLDEFLTDYMNQRTDEYGETFDNSLRIIKEVIHEIRSVVGNKFVVGIRLSQGKVSDQSYKWTDGEEAAENIFTTIGEQQIDYIHVTDGDGTAESFGEGTRSMAKAAKDFGGKPVIANGKLGDPDQALKAVEEEGADFVSLGTGALANPDTPNRVQKGLPLKDFDAESILFPIAHVKDLELNQDIE